MDHRNLSYATIEKNFYNACQHGLNAEVTWLDGKTVSLKDLLEFELFPLAKQGLEELDIAPHDRELFLDHVILPRIQSGQNGSQWQKNFVQNNGKDFQALTAKYYEWQEKDVPVHEWK